MPTNRACLAEFIGVFALMFVGGGAIIAGGDLLTVALAHGLIIAVMVSATMHISGGQFNPAISLALYTIGKQSRSQTITFMIAQLLGAVLAAFLLNMLMSGEYADAIEKLKLGATLGTYTNGEDPNLTSPYLAFGLELIATFFLMFVIMGTVVDSRGVGKTAAVGGFGVGLTVAACILCIGPLTGASLNPARSFGPAMVAGAWNFHWVYWIAPIFGALLAAWAYQGVFGSEEKE